MKSFSKIISLLILVCIFSLNINAAPIQNNTAYSVASNFFTTISAVHNTEMQMVSAPTPEAPYFIYNVKNNGG